MSMLIGPNDHFAEERRTTHNSHEAHGTALPSSVTPTPSSDSSLVVEDEDMAKEVMEVEKASTGVWPSLSEAHLLQHEQKQKQTQEGQTQVPSCSSPIDDNVSSNENENSWEFVSSSSRDQQEQIEDEEHKDNEEMQSSSPCNIHKSISTPEFGKISVDTTKIQEQRKQQRQDQPEEKSYIFDCSSSIDAQSQFTDCTISDQDAVLLSHKGNNNTNATMKKVPSFKDIILLNSQEEQKEADEKQKEESENRRQEALARQNRIKTRPRLVVTSVTSPRPIRRCSKSTGDLRSLVSIQEDHEDHGMGGGGGGLSPIIHEEEEVLGETDAMDYYHRKSKGVSNRSNSKKLRPDEKKRKEMIVNKKNAQRAKQKQQEKGATKSKSSTSSKERKKK